MAKAKAKPAKKAKPTKAKSTKPTKPKAAPQVVIKKKQVRASRLSVAGSGKPSVLKGKPQTRHWTAQAKTALRQIVQDNPRAHWNTISLKLFKATGRLIPTRHIEHVWARMQLPARLSPWTTKDEKRLVELVKKYVNHVPPYAPGWRAIAAELKCSLMQAMTRYKKLVAQMPLAAPPSGVLGVLEPQAPLPDAAAAAALQLQPQPQPPQPPQQPQLQQQQQQGLSYAVIIDALQQLQQQPPPPPTLSFAVIVDAMPAGPLRDSLLAKLAAGVGGSGGVA